MDRYGIQGVGFMLILSILIVMLLNNHASLDWGKVSSSASSISTLTSGSSSKDGSSGMDALHPSLVSGERRRQLLQATPAPAPAPSSSDNGGYISYGALTAGYVPCPPQTGRSYYTQNCQTTTTPVNPYTRGCSSITLCARGS